MLDSTHFIDEKTEDTEGTGQVSDGAGVLSDNTPGLFVKPKADWDTDTDFPISFKDVAASQQL